MASPSHKTLPTSLEIPYYSPVIRQKFKPEVHLGLPTPLQETSYADVDYHFNELKFAARTSAQVQERLQSGKSTPNVLPEGWPQAIQGPLVWSGSDFSDESLFVYHLTEEDKQEIRAALQHFKALGKIGKDVERGSFPLSNLGGVLAQIRDDIYQGRGFAILRGIEVDEFNDADLVTVYLGLTSYVAEVRGKQNYKGSMLIHLVNVSKAIAVENAAHEMPFHTDLVCDVVSTLTKYCSGSGGYPILASAWTIYNELAASRPDLIHVLSQPNWPFDTLAGPPAGEGRRTPGTPGLTEAQAEALDALHAIGLRHELKTSMQRGDIRFVNNMGLLHRRNAYEDRDTSDPNAATALAPRRHLMRLWLHNPKACRALPPALRLAWGRIYYDSDRAERWDLLVEDGNKELFAMPLWDDDLYNPEAPDAAQSIEKIFSLAYQQPQETDVLHHNSIFITLVFLLSQFSRYFMRRRFLPLDSTTSSTPIRPKEMASAQLQALDPTIREICSITGVAGVSVGVLRHGEVIYRESFGFRDVEGDLKGDADTIYYLGSMTKGFTAEAIGILVEEGKVEWTTPVKYVVPEFRPNDDIIYEHSNMIDLLSHRTGLERADSFWAQSNNNILLSREKGIQTVNQLQAVTPFRGEYRYNNWGYEIAGRAIENLTGKKYSDFLSEKIFEPLGMSRTFNNDSECHGAANVAKGYMAFDNAAPCPVPRPHMAEGTLMNPAGGFQSTINDLLKYYATLMKSGNNQYESGATSTPGSPLKQLPGRLCEPVRIWSNVDPRIAS
ncbi:beta-lactamase/transpeptidase-like protein [Apiosordaria backusii]|uniref:Beta-lactamase/transpeptidase-like protein n=1 Tax=Apiosordaria backusii TaxID=314023 RepID=A0AA40BE13_9PEZI|nr:beta-lactamase/transpeptidase-like protein [Apiosordaria backusii]